MKPIFSRLGIVRHVLLSTLALLPAFSPWSAAAQQAPPAAFSFAVYGDSRPMMYLPYKEGQPGLNKFFLEMWGLVLPEKVAEAVVAKDMKMTFDPVTKELIQVVMPFATKSEVTTLTVDKGWVTEASVEDVKLLPGVHRTMFRLQGGEWVTREIVKDVQSGRAKFVVNSGDTVWWGNQGLTVSDSPWRISRSSTRTFRSFTSSRDIVFRSLFLVLRSAVRRVSKDVANNFSSHPSRRPRPRPPQDEVYPTDPSSEIEISFCASTANSIGSCCSTSFTKPLTTRPTASSCESPRWMQ